MSNVLFVCVHNAGRSQMSRALFARAAGARHGARCAGSDPAERVHPEVVTAMDELGIDLRGEVPQRISPALAAWADVVVTMGCGDACPFVPGTRYVDWALDDPRGAALEAVRRTRDEIARLVDALVAELDGRI